MPSFFELLSKKINSGKEKDGNNRIFKLLKWLVGIAGVLIVLSIIFPKAVTVILNILWVLIVSVATIFLILGILVVIGLRKEASHILDILFEKSLRFIDVIEFLKLLYKRFIELLKEFLLYVAPILAFICSAVIYVLLIMVYKSIGKSHDVTLFTIVITIILVVSIALLNKRKLNISDEDLVVTWGKRFKTMFKNAFVDGFEVVLFVFFLTIDSTNLFFLSKDLNVKIFSQFKGYDMMLRGFTLSNHLKWTMSIIGVAIFSEIVRYSMRIVASAKRFYSSIEEQRKTARVKMAVRMAFAHAKPEIVRFIAFTTILFSVFMIFPRLKLLSLAITSLTNFVLDVIMPERLVIGRGKDLMNRVVDKVFRL